MATKLIAFMEGELPDKFKELFKKESSKEVTLGKRSAEDRPVDEEGKDSKPSIKDRIKPREDARDKRIKVAPAIHAEPAGEGVNREGLASNGKPKKDPAKVRCNFYPSCNKPECPFVHPKEPVS